MNRNLESACSDALSALSIGALDVSDDIFWCVYTLLCDMAILLKEPRVLTFDLLRLQSLPGWNQ